VLKVLEADIVRPICYFYKLCTKCPNCENLMPVEVNISELRTIISKIFDHIEHDLGVRSVPLTQDDYWTVLSRERFDLTKCPDVCGVGKLYDDWAFLQPLLDKDKDQAVSLMLIHVAPILRWLGEEVGQ
jgi:hypothetical protein